MSEAVANAPARPAGGSLYRRPTFPKPDACTRCRRSCRASGEALQVAWSHVAAAWICFGCYLRTCPLPGA